MNKKIPIRVISTQDSGTLQVRFWPTDICNFNCTYCFPDSHPGRFRFPKNVDTVIKNFRILFDMYKEQLGKNRFHLMLVGGGEPTLWPHIEYFCKELKESHNVYTTIITNGSRTLNWWRENSKYFDDAVLSCHNEFVDIDHHISVADALFEAGVKVTALMLMDAKNWDKCVSYIERMKGSKYPWFIETKAVVEAPGHGMDVYTPEQLEYLESGLKRIPDSDWIMKNLSLLRQHESVVLFEDGSAQPARPHDLIVNNWNRFQGWSCNVALETLLIKYDGKVTGSCQEPIFFGENFNVFSETFEQDFKANLKFKPIICPRVDCTCQPETHITKTAL